MTAVIEKKHNIQHAGAAPPYPRMRLVCGLVGRAWLWFLAASVAISLIPSIFGWNSYVIITGSMEPGISAGDIVISSSGFTEDDLVGRVITFEDPAVDDHILTHRVTSIEEGGAVITKGDANPTPDSMPVPQDSITGLGRLLVQFVGLPVVWVNSGHWLMLLVFVASVLGSIVAVIRDHEPAQRPHRPMAIPTISGFLALVFVSGTVWAGLEPSISSAAFGASTGSQASVWRVANLEYTAAIKAHDPYLHWKLDETGNSRTADDSSGNGRTGTYNLAGSGPFFERLDSGALVNNDPNRAVRLRRDDSCISMSSRSSINAPQVFTIIAWFRAPASYDDGGKILGFERPRTGVDTPTDGAYDRHLYMDGGGRIWFGVYNNAHVALNSSAGLNDGGWHMAAGTQSPAGMRLYIDGSLVDSNSNAVAETQSGWWRVGCGNLSGWGDHWSGGNNPGTDDGNTENRTFRADLDEVTVFTSALSADEIADLYDSR